jgi:hypothetical protein
MNHARRATLRTAGTVAIAAGVHQLVTGVAGVHGREVADATAAPNLDSEIRFYGGWYAIAGFLMHRLATDAELDLAVGRLVEAGWAAAVAARLLSIRHAGRPAPRFLVLAAAEVGVIAVLLRRRPAAGGAAV